MKMQPLYSQSSRKNDPIQRHIPISLLLGSAPPPPGVSRASVHPRESLSLYKQAALSFLLLYLFKRMIDTT